MTIFSLNFEFWDNLIVTEYVDKGLVKLIKPVYDKKEIYILKKEEWEEYQRLKKRDDRLIGAGFP